MIQSSRDASHGYLIIYVYIVGVMKMGNTVPGVGLEPTSLAFRAIAPHRLPCCHHYPHAYLSMQLLAS